MALIVSVSSLAVNGIGSSTAKTIGIPVQKIADIETIPSTVYQAGTAVTRITYFPQGTQTIPTTVDTATVIATLITACNA